MRHRMAVAVMALVGLLLSLYLWLYKIGMVGPLACGPSGSCERVQNSRWGELFGVPVALYGVAGYLALLVVALIGLQPKWAERPEPTRWLVWLAVPAVLFTGYLKYTEFFIIHAVCRWCVVSAVLIAAILVTAILGMKKRDA